MNEKPILSPEELKQLRKEQSLIEGRARSQRAEERADYGHYPHGEEELGENI